MNIDPKHQQAIDELDELRKSRDDAWQVPRVEGELLYQLALATRAKVIVEIGTSYGFSGLFFAAALKQTGGVLHTIDASQKKFDSSKATFAKADLATLIKNHLGDARTILPQVTGPFDLAFIDADKPSCRAYFDLVWPRLRAGGSVITDNAVTHRAELADFVRHVRSLPEAHSVEIPVGNGIEWTVKLG
jgi:predicted O-methyltransferase YrrM